MNRCGHCGADGEFDSRSGEEYHRFGYWCYDISMGYSFDPNGEYKTPEECRQKAKERLKTK